jgi:diaminohydroxyphosphoribosylaminopyrimidine deaminase/5-amino-6-(5-phosphoribosylamino)uracil reductase
MRSTAEDVAHMRAALALAGRNLGRTWPNPAVGCVIVASGRVVGRGWTARGGRPHAEAIALERAGPAASGATAYVTLEPCAHVGRAGPCADALANAGIARVVAALEDPDPRTAGQGFSRLRQAGVRVEVGLEAAAAAALNAGFLRRFVGPPRPFVTVKMASSLDGRIGTRTGESRWITGPAARARGHLLRARSDAILVGIGTALADDPELTCRIPGLEDTQPLRVVLDRTLRLPPTHRLARDATRWPTLVLAAAGADPERSAALHACGVEIVPVAEDDGGLDLDGCLRILAERGVTRLLCEGGGRVAAALLAGDVVDEILRFTGGIAIGADGVPALGSLGVDRLADAPRFQLRSVEACGDGVVELWARSSDASASATCSPA